MTNRPHIRVYRKKGQPDLKGSAKLLQENPQKELTGHVKSDQQTEGDLINLKLASYMTGFCIVSCGTKPQIEERRSRSPPFSTGCLPGPGRLGPHSSAPFGWRRPPRSGPQPPSIRVPYNPRLSVNTGVRRTW